MTSSAVGGKIKNRRNRSNKDRRAFMYDSDKDYYD